MQSSDLNIITTRDGSHTIFDPEHGEHFHSIHGARQESMHVFIHAGFTSHTISPVSVLEMVFCSGLNAWLTCMEARETKRKTMYHTLEKYPLSDEIAVKLNYSENETPENTAFFHKIHSAGWEVEEEIHEYFTIKKVQADIAGVKFSGKYDVIFYDAFSPAVQPELWTYDIFSALFRHTNRNGILTTYSAKGEVQRILKRAGFSVELISGPPGKKEMIRAIRI